MQPRVSVTRGLLDTSFLIEPTTAPIATYNSDYYIITPL
jgi:hypothetical protein